MRISMYSALCFSLLTVSVTVAEAQPAPTLQDAAAVGMVKLLPSLTLPREGKFDPVSHHMVFVGEEQHVVPADCKITGVFPVIGISQQKLKAYQANDSVTSVYAVTNTWLLPLTYKGQDLGCLEVSHTVAGFEATGVGFAPVQASLAGIKKAFPDKHVDLLTVEGHMGFLFAVPSVSTTQLGHIPRKNMDGSLPEAKLLPAAEVLNALRGIDPGGALPQPKE